MAIYKKGGLDQYFLKSVIVQIEIVILSHTKQYFSVSFRFSVFARHFAEIHSENPGSLQCIHGHLTRGLDQAIKVH